MVALLRFIASNAWLVSLICLLGAIRYVWKAIEIHRSGTITPYVLERESAVGQVERAWITAVILAIASLIILLASPFILRTTDDFISEAAPTLVAGILTRTPTPPVPVTPTLPLPTDSPSPQVSVTPSVDVALPADTPEPNATPTAQPAPANCPDPHVQLTAPATGQVLVGMVEIQGVADIPNFGFYKIEISGPLTGGDWWTIGDVSRTPVNGGVLGYWDASPVVSEAPGLYSFRLVVVDSTGNYPPPCTIQVRIAPE